MALIRPATSPTIAISRALKRAGLEQGKGKGFQVQGRYRNGERQFTHVRVYGTRAEAVVAERADDIERWTEESGFPFRVSVHYMGRWPVSDIHNGPRPRVRQEAPAPAVEEPTVQESAEEATPAPAAEEPAAVDRQDVTAAAPVAAVEEPAAVEPAPEPEAAVSYAEDYRQEQQAKALGWSTRHAELVRWAAAGELRMEGPDDLRRVTIPGRAGRRVAAALLRPLAAAAFVALGELDEEGRHRVEVTGDGRRALEAWDRKSPAPAVISRKQEGRADLRPLLGGEEHRRRAAEFEADLKRRAAEREAWYAAFDLRRAEEEREDRLRAVWAEVEGIWNPFSRRPAGWTPMPEQVEEFRIRPELTAELEEEAARLAAADDSRAPATPAPVEVAQEAPEDSAGDGRRTAPHPPSSVLTLQSSCVSIGVSGRPNGQRTEGTPRHDHHSNPQHRGRRRHHRRTDHEGDRGRRPRGPRPGDRRHAHDRGRGPGRHPELLHPQPRQGVDRAGRRHRHRSGRDRRLLQLGRHLTAPAGRSTRGARPPPAPRLEAMPCVPCPHRPRRRRPSR
ncbi:hypothetical protein WB388_40345 [Streptomyces brasiliscabiei]|uniref:Uncharacterized protein n=1 Tax=Streptomyces brasiliscabiei TaxID=2736302 RepID=A0ABU8GQ11_9ACTN